MRLKRKHLLLLTVILLLVAAVVGLKNCRGYIKGKAPVAIVDTLPVSVPMSHFQIPISFSLEAFETFINGKIQGEFLEATITPTDNKKDSVKVEMRKVQSILISSTGQELVIKFPLEVKATILRSRVNFLTKGIEPVVTQLVLELHTPVDLDKDWRLLTEFSLKKITWVKPPQIKVVGFNIDLTSKINDLIQSKKKALCDQLDVEIHKAVSLHKPVEKIWLDLQKLMIINKKPPEAYLKFMCHAIAGDLLLDEKNIICNTSIDAQVAMVTKTNLQAEAKPLPEFKKQPIDNYFSDVNVLGFAEFSVVNAELNEKLDGKTFTVKGITASIKNIQVFAADSGLAVNIETKGDVDSKLVASVVPSFDSIHQRFLLSNPQFDVNSGNALLNMGDALLHETILDAVKDDLQLSMDSLITKVPDIVEKAIAKGKTGQSIDVSMDEFSIRSCRITMDAKRIYFLVNAQFKSAIAIKRINAGKQIKITPKGKRK
ncbi:MAG TPA: DUF4403 family protein [Phnomibacter sp.]|nr:DUF4403 family protein [Phnomibacter sp.]